jgi:hypothetical protein
MPLVVECRCRQRFSAADHLVGTVAACPACGSPITIVAPPAANVPPASGPLPNPHGTASQQLRQNPFWFFLRGVEMPEHQAAPTTHRARTVRTFVLAGLGLTVFSLAMLTFLIATARFGLALGAGMPLMGLGVAFVPLLFGFYFLATALFESQLLMMSRRGRGVRYLFGDQGARWFFIAVACPALLIGLGIQLVFLAGAIFGRDPDRKRNAPAAAADPQHEFHRPALPAAEAERLREEMIEEHRRRFADILKDPEMAAEFEKSLQEQFPDRKAPPR